MNRLGVSGFARSPVGNFALKIPVTGTIDVTLEVTACDAEGYRTGDFYGAVDVTLNRTTIVAVGDSDGEIATMARIEDILTRVRDTLADPNKERWTDERLMRLMDEAQKDVAKQSKILKGTYELAIQSGIATYTLPDDMWLLTRATYGDVEIPLVSYDRQDERVRKLTLADRRQRDSSERTVNDFNWNYGSTWELDTGSDVQSLIYDQRNINEIRVYPIPDDSISDYSYPFENAGYVETTTTVPDSELGVLTGVEDPDSLADIYGVTTSAVSVVLQSDGTTVIEATEDVGFSSLYGVLVAIEDNLASVGFHGDELLGDVVEIEDYTMDNLFGFTTTLYDPAIDTELFDTPYGIVTNINETSANIKLWYIKLPAALENSLELPPMFDVALKYYIVGHALRDDIDVQYRQMGAESLELYERELGIAKDTDRTDGTRNATNFNTTFRGGFE